jgi:nitrogen regulatory protein P-II 1
MSETMTQIGTLAKLEVIIKPGKLDAVKKAMGLSGYTGVTISQAEGHGNQKGLSKQSENGNFRIELLPKLRMEIVVAAKDVEPLIQAISKAAQTGEQGDGKIFVSEIKDVVRIRTGERGAKAL